MLIHPHIQHAFQPVGKSAMRRIYLVRRDAQVSQDTIGFIYSMNPQHFFQVSEILIDKNQPLIMHHILLRFLILIKSEQLSIAQFLQDRPAVPSASIGCIHINTTRPDLQPFHGLQQ